MKIVVLVKEVPDTYGDRKLSLETGLADRGASERVIDEICERALEVALSYADAHAGTEVVVLSMASEAATATVRKGLAMGAVVGRAGRRRRACWAQTSASPPKCSRRRCSARASTS